MKQYDKNPRKISEQQLHDLETWLRELGDLSGVVHDLNSDQIIGGNQRSKVFDTKPGEICLEPFCGSGSQILAGQQEGRRVYAAELEPAFVAVALQRFEDATGIKPKRLERA